MRATILAGILLVVISLALLLNRRQLQTHTCTPVQILAVGGCDSDALCGVVAGTMERELVKGKMQYPVAGILDCRESINE